MGVLSRNPFAPGNKYGAHRTWSDLCQREFASKAEARRGEELWTLWKAGEISSLVFQPKWVLIAKPKRIYTADFEYLGKDKKLVVEDVKGRDTEASSLRRAMLLERYGIKVKVIRKEV